MSENITIKLPVNSGFTLETFLADWEKFGRCEQSQPDIYFLHYTEKDSIIVFTNNTTDNELSFDGHFDYPIYTLLEELAKKTNSKLLIEGEPEETNSGYLGKWQSLNPFLKILTIVFIIVLLPLIIVLFPLFLIWALIRLIITLLLPAKKN